MGATIALTFSGVGAMGAALGGALAADFGAGVLGVAIGRLVGGAVATLAMAHKAGSKKSVADSALGNVPEQGIGMSFLGGVLDGMEGCEDLFHGLPQP